MRILLFVSYLFLAMGIPVLGSLAELHLSTSGLALAVVGMALFLVLMIPAVGTMAFPREEVAGPTIPLIRDLVARQRYGRLVALSESKYAKDFFCWLPDEEAVKWAYNYCLEYGLAMLFRSPIPTSCQFPEASWVAAALGYQCNRSRMAGVLGQRTEPNMSLSPTPRLILEAMVSQYAILAVLDELILSDPNAVQSLDSAEDLIELYDLAQMFEGRASGFLFDNLARQDAIGYLARWSPAYAQPAWLEAVAFPPVNFNEEGVEDDESIN